ncbi:MAG: NADH-quinone oxidoreductase subunit NuoG [Nitrospirota bacterium]
MNNKQEPDKDITLTIDGKAVTVRQGTNLIEAAKTIGIEIPFFCYHPKMSVIGACRMCLVEIENSPKLQTACSTEAREGMVVYTESKRVKKAREGILEFLLINHPLDCPVCDKGGECPLQDITYRFGPVKSRFIEEKWHFKKPVPISDKILIDRERCIMCMRCTRFCDEIADHHQIGTINSGRAIEIGLLSGKSFDSIFSGNTIEVCPVGALTSRSYRFRSRPWEFKRTATICTRCAVGCNIYIDRKKNDIVRVVSRENSDVDDGWLCDRGRFGFEHVHKDKRLTQPLIRKDGRLEPSNWSEAIEVVSNRLSEIKERYGANSIGAIASPLCTNEEGYLFQRFFKNGIGTENIGFWDNKRGIKQEIILKRVSGMKRFSFKDIDNASLIFLMGIDITKDQPVLDLRIKKAIRKNGATLIIAHNIDHIEDCELARYAKIRFGYKSGNEEALLIAIAQVSEKGEMNNDVRNMLIEGGISPEEVSETSDILKGVDKKVILIGDVDKQVEDSLITILNNLCQVNHKNGWISFGRLLLYANSQGMLDIFPDGNEVLTSMKEMGLKGLYIIGAPSHANNRFEMILKDRWEGLEFLVVSDNHVSDLTAMADVVFPNLTFAEKNGTMTNTGSRVQRLRRGIKPIGEAKSDWEILLLLSNRLGTELYYTSVRDIMEDIEKEVNLYNNINYEILGQKGRERG